MTDAWEGLGPTTYQADGFEAIQIPVRSVSEDGGLRVVERARPWQPGAKLDETGATPDKYTLESLVNDDAKEVEHEGETIWPDLIDALVAQFKSGKTGRLNLPWKRGIRVKPETWGRRASADENRGGELFTVTFKTDNEDNLDREAFAKVSVKATVERAAEETTFSLEQEGMFGDIVGDIVGLASELRGIMDRPSEYAQAVATAATRLRRAGQILMGEYSTNTPGRDQFNGPEGSSARAKLLDLMELAARAEEDARAYLPKTRTYTARRRTDIWAIATELRQDARVLMSINSDIEDFSNIAQGTPVVVFAE